MSDETSQVITLQRPVILIGRHLDCDARIDHSKISRRHCCVAIAYDRIILRDLGSRNGIRVNGRKVEEVRLQVGDEVAIGPVLFRFEGQATLQGRPGPAGSTSRPGPASAASPPVPGQATPGAQNWLLDDSDLDLMPLDESSPDPAACTNRRLPPFVNDLCGRSISMALTGPAGSRNRHGRYSTWTRGALFPRCLSLAGRPVIECNK